MFPMGGKKKPMQDADPDAHIKGAGDYGHARLAQKLIAAKMGGGAPAAPEPDADHMGGAPDMDADNAMPPTGDAGDGAMIPMELSPEEAAMIEKLRAAKSGVGGDMPPPAMG